MWPDVKSLWLVWNSKMSMKLDQWFSIGSDFPPPPCPMNIWQCFRTYLVAMPWGEVLLTFRGQGYCRMNILQCPGQPPHNKEWSIWSKMSTVPWLRQPGIDLWEVRWFCNVLAFYLERGRATLFGTWIAQKKDVLSLNKESTNWVLFSWR